MEQPGEPTGGAPTDPTPAPAAPAQPAPNAAPPEPAATTDPAQVSSPTSPDLSFFGEDFMKDGALDTDAVQTHWQDMLAEEAKRAEANADIPKDGRYDFKLPEDMDYGEIQLPEGVKIELAPVDDPAFAPVYDEAAKFLHENGIGASKAKGLVQLMAKFEAAKTAQLHAKALEGYNSLGANDQARDARIAKVNRAIESRLPADAAAALKSVTRDPGALRALETLLSAPGLTAPTPTPKNAVDPKLTGYALLKAANAAKTA